MSFLNYLVETSLENIKSDIELSNWMKKNIKYKEFIKLMSADEVMKERKGSCHDQVMFELYWLKKLGYNPKAIFFIEYNDNDGGETHSFVYYNKKDKVCWFENAWGGNEGIKEFASLFDIKNYIRECHKNGKLGNIKTYPNIEITSFKNHKPGETLQEFVDICTGGNKPITESVDKSVLDKNFKKKTGLKFEIIDINDNRVKSIVSDKFYEWIEEIKDKKNGIIAVESKSKVFAGFIFVSKNHSDKKVIAPFKVYEKFRGYGLGEILLKEAITRFDGNELGVYEDNEIAIKLYKKYGFREVDTKIYKDGDKVIIMRRK